MKRIVFFIVFSLTFVACGYKQIATCKSYKNGICEIKETKRLKECKKMYEVDGKKYCED